MCFNVSLVGTYHHISPTYALQVFVDSSVEADIDPGCLFTKQVSGLIAELFSLALLNDANDLHCLPLHACTYISVLLQGLSPAFYMLSIRHVFSLLKGRIITICRSLKKNIREDLACYIKHVHVSRRIDDWLT